MSLFPVGVLIAIAAFAAAVKHLNQGFGSYYDLVALLMVTGGTISVAVILIPWNLRRDLVQCLRELVKPASLNHKSVLMNCIATIRQKKTVVDDHIQKEIYATVLADGIELIDLGFSEARIEGILVERLRSFSTRRRKIANSIRNLAKYPPAFGLMGTVLGLVNVMRGVSNGGDGKQTALEMAIALVATMYGLIISNLIVNPAGELILRKTSEHEAYGEIAIESICLLAKNTSLLESQEILNSYVPIEHRIDVLKEQFEEMAA